MADKKINGTTYTTQDLIKDLHKAAFFLHFFLKSDLTEDEKRDLKMARHYLEVIK